ncbi:HAMP domain-containing sensor histidine kinase [Sphingomonas alpina]|uniref:histidine kinase n=1 Tax=Sphingomonas alpina TaxID=653931 RepID=A0A7H0LE40_9SPHN|nr:HAMP domain-containing sensor histidine kinase [Sphingomonas alpina]QNQ07943.1 HAMP domain-containing histidine kinase [Sphingomonas alpina]
MKRLSVTARIALLAIALALVSNLALVGFVWQQIHDDAVGALRRNTLEQSDALVAVWRSGGMPALIQAIEVARAPGDESLILAVIDRSGRRIGGIGPDRVTLEGDGTSFQIGRAGASPPWSDRDAGYAVRTIGSNRLISGRLLDDWEQEQRDLEGALALAVLLSLALGIGGGLVIARYVGRRLNGVASVIEGVADGDLSRRVVTLTGSGDPFDRLASQLNAMLDKLERLMGELRLVTDSLAHDLRSPLSRLRSKTEGAVLMEDPAQREAALGGLIAETDIVMRMLTTLIEISRAESISRDRFSLVDPAELIEEIAELYAPVVEDAGMRMIVALDARPPALLLHRELISQAVTNLADNALRHGAGGGSITLRLSTGADEVRLQVEDHGPGIAAEDRAQALRRFGRLDSARTTPGAGLGLALIEAVARLHGGRFDLDDNAPGLIAAIVLPA